MEYMTGDICVAGGAHYSGTPDLTLDISRVHVFSSSFCDISTDFVFCPLVYDFALIHWYFFLDKLNEQLQKGVSHYRSVTCLNGIASEICWQHP